MRSSHWTIPRTSIAQLLPRRLVSSHSAALLLISYRGYRFILAYGRGWQAIERSWVDPRFGLRVVANAVSADRVRSVETRTLGGRHLSRYTAMPTAGPLYELGIEPINTLVRQLEGIPSPNLAGSAAGSDSLRLKISHFSLAQLGEKLDQIIQLDESDAYKQDYDFLDYYHPIRNEPVQLRLNGEVDRLLREGSHQIAFAPPDVGEPITINHYVLCQGKRVSQELPELTAESVASVIADWSVKDPLELRVAAYDASGEAVGRRLRLRHYVVTETVLDGQAYIAAAGDWYQVDTGFLAELQRGITAIPDCTAELDLPEWDLNQYPEERHYNDSLACRGWKVLDRRHFMIERPGQKVEICDLLTPAKQLLCVKRMTSSSALSHLFNQGWVSWQLLADNTEGSAIPDIQGIP